MAFTNPQTTLVLPTDATSGARIVLDGTTGIITVYGADGSILSLDPTNLAEITLLPGTSLTGLTQGSIQADVIIGPGGARPRLLIQAPVFGTNDTTTLVLMPQQALQSALAQITAGGNNIGVGGGNSGGVVMNVGSAGNVTVQQAGSLNTYPIIPTSQGNFVPTLNGWTGTWVFNSASYWYQENDVWVYMRWDCTVAPTSFPGRFNITGLPVTAINNGMGNLGGQLTWGNTPIVGNMGGTTLFCSLPNPPGTLAGTVGQSIIACGRYQYQ